MLAALDMAVEEGGGNVRCQSHQSHPELAGPRPLQIRRHLCVSRRETWVKSLPDMLALEGARSDFYFQCVHKTFKYHVLSRCPSC